MKKYKALIERKNDLVTRAKEIVNGAETEKRELTDAESQELAEIHDDVMKIKEALGIMDDIDDEDREEVPADGDGKKDNTEEQERRAFENYIRGVVNERANLVDSGNGAVIPKHIANKIIKKVYDICPILEKSTKYNVKGKIDIPVYTEDSTDFINVGYATEFVDLTANIGTFDKVELGGYLAGALSLISRSLINNTEFNLVDFVTNQMAYAIARFIEGELIHGTANKVEGLSTLTNGITAASASAITADEVIALKDKVKDVYQQGAMWIMSSATRTAIRQLKNAQGMYLLNDDLSTPFGESLLGKPVYVSDNMDDIATGKVVIYYGDFAGLATKFAEEINIEVLREKYATQHAIGVVGWFEFDSKIENAQMLAKLTMA